MSLVAKLARQPSWDVFGPIRRILNPTVLEPEAEHTDLKPFIYGDEWVMLEVEVINPPSMEGRKALVVLYDSEITELLLKLRERAIQIRSRPMGKS